MLYLRYVFSRVSFLDTKHLLMLNLKDTRSLDYCHLKGGLLAYPWLRLVSNLWRRVVYNRDQVRLQGESEHTQVTGTMHSASNLERTSRPSQVRTRLNQE